MSTEDSEREELQKVAESLDLLFERIKINSDLDKIGGALVVLIKTLLDNGTITSGQINRVIKDIK